jgi:hypothetical protein
MPIQSRLIVAGMSAVAAAASVGAVANNMTAVAGGQGSATPLPADNNRFTTVPASGGAIVPALNPGDNLVIINAGANALLVFPPVGGQINALGTNASYSVATATPYCTVACITPTQYHAFQSA